MDSRADESLATIPPDVELVIFDCYDTLLHFDLAFGWVPREGLAEVLDHLRGRRLAVASDGAEDEIRVLLGRFARRFFGVYGRSKLLWRGLRYLKDLGRICRDAAVPPERAVMVGDNRGGVDAASAKRFAVRFIQVPPGDGFSLASLIPPEATRPAPPRPRPAPMPDASPVRR